MEINKIITLENGSRIVEFIRDYYYATYDFQRESYTWSNTFRLNEENLKTRIANRKKYNLDTSVEERALFLLTE